MSAYHAAAEGVTPRPINAALKGIFGAERHWVASLRVPFGVSMAMVAEPTIR